MSSQQGVGITHKTLCFIVLSSFRNISQKRSIGSIWTFNSYWTAVYCIWHSSQIFNVVTMKTQN